MQRRAAEESLTDHGKDNSNGRAHVGDAIRHKPGILGFLRQIGFMGATASIWAATSASIAWPSNCRAPARNISVSGSSENDSGWRNATTVSSFMAYPFLRKIGVFINARIRRLHSPSPRFSYSSPTPTPVPVPVEPAPVPSVTTVPMTPEVQPSTIPKPAPQDLSMMVVRVQAALMRLGYYNGDIDGLLAEPTRSALKAYQKAQGVPQTGRIDLATLTKLGISIP